MHGPTNVTHLSLAVRSHAQKGDGSFYAQLKRRMLFFEIQPNVNNFVLGSPRGIKWQQTAFMQGKYNFIYVNVTIIKTSLSRLQCNNISAGVHKFSKNLRANTNSMRRKGDLTQIQYRGLPILE